MSNNILVIGDVHGKLNAYKSLIDNHNGLSIQVGDFGFKMEHKWHLKNVDSSKHKICFGNHDDYTFLYKPHSLSNSSFWYDEKIMTIRGAYSIDKHYRIEGQSWWANEEMNVDEMQQTIDIYEFNKPKIVIAHECPNIVRNNLFGISDRSITTNGMQAMFDIHKPDMWIFGHYHRDIDTVIDGTRFVCLNELSTIII